MMKHYPLLSVSEFLIAEFFNRELPAFVNLPNSLTAWEVNRAVGLFLLLLIVATAVLTWRKSVLEMLPRRLLSEGITAPEDAKTASELGLKITLGMRFALRSYGVGVRLYMRMVGEQAPTFKKKKTHGGPIDVQADNAGADAADTVSADTVSVKADPGDGEAKMPFYKSVFLHFFPDLSEARFYMDPNRVGDEHGQLAEKKFAENGFTPKVLLYTALISVVVFLVACRLMPQILLLVDSLL